MKKIMFSDKMGLTEAVLKGKKTMTRRIVNPQPVYDEDKGLLWKGAYSGLGIDNPRDAYRNFRHNSLYKVGEVVAIAQSYATVIKGEDQELAEKVFNHLELNGYGAGLDNKMFVRADLMPHRIKITRVEVDRLQNISIDDCFKEGVEKTHNLYYRLPLFDGHFYRTPITAFTAMIEKTSEKGTWARNPYVFVYEFELIEKGGEG